LVGQSKSLIILNKIPSVAPQLCGDHIAHIVIDDAVDAPDTLGKKMLGQKSSGKAEVTSMMV
jgi:hypothetical protein